MESSRSPSISKRDLPVSPTRALDSSKKRTLKFSVNRVSGKNGNSEVSASPIRKSPPLLTSTPKPPAKDPQLLPSVLSDLQILSVNMPISHKVPFVKLNRNAVSDYFAKKNAPTANVADLAKEVRTKSSKRPGPTKPTAEKKSARVSRNPRSTKSEPKELAAHLPKVAATTVEDINISIIKSPETNVCQQVGPCNGITTKIPSDILVTFGITSHNPGARSDSPNSTITEALSPKAITEALSPNAITEALSPKAMKITSVPENENSHLPGTTRNTPATFGIDAFCSMDVVPHSTSTIRVDRSPGNISIPTASNRVMDAMDSGSCSENEEQLSITSHYYLHFELNRRLYDSPAILQLEDLRLGSKDVRRVAPYSLKVADDEERFFLYAAVLTEIEGKYCCLVFGIIDQYMVAYGGHFIVSKDRIYNPVLKTPVENVNVTNLADCRHHLSLFNIQNERLLQYDGYFQSLWNPSYDILQSKFVDSFLHSLDQVMLKERIRCETVRNESVNLIHSSSSGAQFPITCTIKEPRTQQVFHETSLIITQQRMGHVLNFVQTMGNIKKHYAELAVMQASCALHPTFHTTYYVAHEDSGCTAFYPSAYVLGISGDHYVIGVIVDEIFFIMATKRLFSRTDELVVGLKSVARSAELFESISLPLYLAYEHALVMLEVRQILKHPEEHREQLKELNQALGIAGFRSLSLTNSFFDLTSTTQPKSRRLHNAWLEQTLDGHFNTSVRNAPCKFPPHPSCSANPLIFCENMLKLWMQRLQREIYDIAECDLSDGACPLVLSDQEFFTLNPTSFVAYFLPIFGLTEEHAFQCLTLDSNGEPSGVCLEKISASGLGHHIENCHIRPLLWDDSASTQEISFSPFTLVFRKCENPSLSETCDLNLLKWARAMGEKWHLESPCSYVKFIETLTHNQKLQNSFTANTQQVNSTEKQRNRKKNSPGAVSSKKRKRTLETSDVTVVEEDIKRRCLSQVSEPSD